MYKKLVSLKMLRRPSMKKIQNSKFNHFHLQFIRKMRASLAFPNIQMWQAFLVGYEKGMVVIRGLEWKKKFNRKCYGLCPLCFIKFLFFHQIIALQKL